MKHSSDKEELQKLIAEHQEEYYNVSRKTCELIAVLTNSKELLKPELYENIETGGVNMCKALEDMKLEKRQEGIQIGFFQALRDLVKDGIINASEAASRMQISEDDFIARMNGEEAHCEEYNI